MTDGFVQQVEIDEAADTARQQRFPVGATIEFDDLEEHARLGALDALRDAEPVSWVPALGGWLVTSHELASEVLRRRTGFTVEADTNLVRASLGSMMLTTDPPDHSRLRTPFDEPFRVREVRARFEAGVRSRIDELLSSASESDTADFVKTVAEPFAIGSAAEALGLSLDDVPKIQGFYDAFASAMVYDGDPEPQRLADAARSELNEILHGQVQRLRTAPDASVTSTVANTDNLEITDDELVAQLRVILFGAIETVESMVTNALYLLLGAPNQMEAVRSDLDLTSNAVEEGMRLIPPVAFIERWTDSETTLGEVELGRGEFIGVSTVAANRDPALFPDPATFDVRRKNTTRQLAFSLGAHHCLGINLARLQGDIAVRATLERFPNLALVSAPQPNGFAFRRSSELNLSWHRL